MKILFVCSGNICRSPMAAACMRRRAADVRLSELVVDSAGLLGIEGQPASASAVEALREIGLDLTAHRSRGLQAADFLHFDVIVAMTGEHLAQMRERFPQGRAALILLRAFEQSPTPAAQPPDLEDPIGWPIEFYRQRLAEILRSVANLARALTHAGGREIFR